LCARGHGAFSGLYMMRVIMALCLQCCAPALASVIEVTAANIDEIVEEKSSFLKFFAPWCGHCKKLSPTWDALGALPAEELDGVQIGRVDCTVQKDLCKSRFGIRSYPTLLFLPAQATAKVMHKHAGGRSTAQLAEFARGGWRGAPLHDPTALPPPRRSKSIVPDFIRTRPLLAVGTIVIVLATLIGLAALCCLGLGSSSETSEKRE